MLDGNRVYPVNKLVMHHAVSDEMRDWEDIEVQDWFSNVGKARGYQNGAINPFHEHPSRPGQLTYAMAHFCLHPYTKDGNKYGWRLTPLIARPFDNVAWHAGNWPVNQQSIGIETAGNYLSSEVDPKALMLVADTFRDHDKALGGALEVYPHQAFFSTQCPGQIVNQIATLIDMINSPEKWNEQFWPTPAPKPAEDLSTRYTRFPQPVKYMAMANPTNVYDVSKTSWNDLSNSIVKRLAVNEEFIAVGEYRHPLGGVYYMTQYSFGDADKTGVPNKYNGVNKADLWEKLDYTKLDPVINPPAPEPTPSLPSNPDVKPAEPTVEPTVKKPSWIVRLIAFIISKFSKKK